MSNRKIDLQNYEKHGFLFYKQEDIKSIHKKNTVILHNRFSGQFWRLSGDSGVPQLMDRDIESNSRIIWTGPVQTDTYLELVSNEKGLKSLFKRNIINYQKEQILKDNRDLSKPLILLGSLVLLPKTSSFINLNNGSSSTINFPENMKNGDCQMVHLAPSECLLSDGRMIYKIQLIKGRRSE